MTITKAHLTDSVHNQLDLPKAKSAGLVESVFEIMKNTLENGEDILISGFGKFCIKGKRDRRGRNPLTGEDMMLEARRVVTFKCSLPLKQKLNGEGYLVSIHKWLFSAISASDSNFNPRNTPMYSCG